MRNYEARMSSDGAVSANVTECQFYGEIGGQLMVVLGNEGVAVEVILASCIFFDFVNVIRWCSERHFCGGHF